MKKLLVYLLAMAALVSTWLNVTPLVASAAENDPVVTFSDIISIKDDGSGMWAGANSAHGNEMTRVVHTSHGDYVAYITDSFIGNDNICLAQISVMKVNEDGTTEFIYSNYNVNENSGISLFVDNDENVWCVTSEETYYKAELNRPTRLYVSAYCIDAETDEVMTYSAILDEAKYEGYGKTDICYDTTSNQVYVFQGAWTGTDKAGAVVSIFDLNTRKWDPYVRGFDTEHSQCYKFIFADGNGGVYMIDERTIHNAVLRYSEIEDNIGLTEEELEKINRWSASYIWDQLLFTWIPDVSDDSVKSYNQIAVAGDYSKVLGDYDYRHSYEGRTTNLYPLVQNSNGGDFYVTSDGYFHLTYCYQYGYHAADRSTDSQTWYHEVFDMSDPANIKSVYRGVLSEDTKDRVATCETSWRMYEDSDGQLYFISGYTDDLSESDAPLRDSVLRVISVDGNPEDGYTYRTLASMDYVGYQLVNVSNARSNSVQDDVIDVIFKSGASSWKGDRSYDDYHFVRINLSDLEPIQSGMVDVTVEMKDQNGNALSIGTEEFEVIATKEDGSVLSGTMDDKGSVTFENLTFETEGAYEYTLSMKTGTDNNIQYSKEQYKVTLHVERVDNVLKVTKTDILKDGAAAESVVFSVVKTISNAGDNTGDNTGGSSGGNTGNNSGSANTNTGASNVVADNTNTGDNSFLLLWVVLAVVAGSAVTGYAVISKRK